MLLFKILSTLWPFVREMFFAGKSVKDIILGNKIVVALLTALLLSISLNWITIGKIMEIAVGRREGAEVSGNKNKTGDKPAVPGPPDPPTSSPASSDIYIDTRKALDKIYKERRPS